MNLADSCLFTPPSSIIIPPLETSEQHLPLSDLSWEDFEKLILRIVEIEFQRDDCEIYGRKGQRQEGIDIYAFKGNSKYNTYQCKRYKKLKASNLSSAVELFMEGEWFERSDSFFFCTSFSMDDIKLQNEFETQKGLLKQQGVRLKKLDKNNIERLLKNYPTIVYDFFGESWVERFNGKIGLSTISPKRKLDAAKVREYRIRLSRFYSTVFNTTDTGIPLADRSIFTIEERYIIPDLIYSESELQIDEEIMIPATIAGLLRLVLLELKE